MPVPKQQEPRDPNLKPRTAKTSNPTITKQNMSPKKRVRNEEAPQRVSSEIEDRTISTQIPKMAKSEAEPSKPAPVSNRAPRRNQLDEEYQGATGGGETKQRKTPDAKEGPIGARQCRHPTSAPDTGAMQACQGQREREESGEAQEELKNKKLAKADKSKMSRTSSVTNKSK